MLLAALEQELTEAETYLPMWDWMQAQTGRWSPMRPDGRHLDWVGVDRLMFFCERSLATGEVPGLSLRHRAASVLKDAAGDNYLKVPTGVSPVGPGNWVSSGAAIVPSLHGARPFFLSSASQLRVAPPTFGSKAFNDALFEIRQISDTISKAQLDLATHWAGGLGAFTISALNLKADSIIRIHHGTELEAAR